MLSGSVVREAPARRDRRAVAIMFTDVVGFTQTTERLGDAPAHRLLMAHDVVVRSRLTAFGGREVKTTGDGFLTTFASAVRALECAAAVQADLAELRARDADALRVRIGVHVGSVIRAGQDVHGWNVILAARVAELAGGGEVLVSSVARGVAERSGRFRFGGPRRVALAGMSGDHVVHELLWDEPAGELEAADGA